MSTNSLRPLILHAHSTGPNPYKVAIALEALNRGYTVIATARNSSKLADLATKGALTADLDVTHDLETLTATVAALHARVGRFDVFINAAGYILEGAIEEAR